MRITSSGLQTSASSAESLLRTLDVRDSLGGAEYWLSEDFAPHPCLAIRFSSALADVHYFPQARHPGFRMLSRLDLPRDASTLFRFEGCDPAAGEPVPNAFVVSVADALHAAVEFFETGAMPRSASWLEL